MRAVPERRASTNKIVKKGKIMRFAAIREPDLIAGFRHPRSVEFFHTRHRPALGPVFEKGRAVGAILKIISQDSGEWPPER